MCRKVLILGGTKEAAEHAAALVAQSCQVVTSLAGRTKEPRPVAGEVRIGGFGGADGLARYIRDNSITELIDATHPFAHQISANAVQAAKQAAIPLTIAQRHPWQKQVGDTWKSVKDISEAIAAIPKNARVLLALGRQHIAAFAERDDVFFLIRMVDKPDQNLPFQNHTLLIGKPSSDRSAERAMLEANAITHIVCRNSGGAGAYAKIEAARELTLPVIMIERVQNV